MIARRRADCSLIISPHSVKSNLVCATRCSHRLSRDDHYTVISLEASPPYENIVAVLHHGACRLRAGNADGPYAEYSCQAPNDTLAGCKCKGRDRRSAPRDETCRGACGCENDVAFDLGSVGRSAACVGNNVRVIK